MKSKWWIVEELNEYGMRKRMFLPYISRPIFYDLVSFDASMTAEEVKRSLVDHDGYPSNITVTRER